MACQTECMSFIYMCTVRWDYNPNSQPTPPSKTSEGIGSQCVHVNSDQNYHRFTWWRPLKRVISFLGLTPRKSGLWFPALEIALRVNILLSVSIFYSSAAWCKTAFAILPLISTSQELPMSFSGLTSWRSRFEQQWSNPLLCVVHLFLSRANAQKEFLVS